MTLAPCRVMVSNAVTLQGMAAQTMKVLIQIIATFVGVHLATGLLTIILSIGQQISYLYQWVAYAVVMASLTTIVIYYAIKQEAEPEATEVLLLSQFQQPSVTKSNAVAENHRLEQLVPEYPPDLKTPLFAATKVENASPSAESHPIREESSVTVEDGQQRAPAVVRDLQELMPSAHAVDPQTVVNTTPKKKKKKNKKPKVCVSHDGMSTN